MPKEELKCGQYDKAIDAYHKCGDCDLCTVKEVEKKVEEDLMDLVSIANRAMPGQVTHKIAEVVVKMEKALEEAIKAERERVLGEVGKKYIVCKFCKKPFDESSEGYDGYANCNCCEKVKYTCDNHWNDVGYNKALDEVIDILNPKE